ncbi:MAG TPA: type II secretion system protein [Verrucomicrobiae bacterium]|nr:type II secretion system protein [Verrucomicrobiae bacterium]
MEVFVIIAILAILAAMILPALRAGRSINSHTLCVNNLQGIGAACRVWAGNNNDKYPMEVSVTNGGAREMAFSGEVAGAFRAMSNELYTPKILICPKDTSRTCATSFASGFNNANISYFVSLDADPSFQRAFLSGDDNFAISGEPLKSGLLQLTMNTPIAWAVTRHVKVGNVLLDDGSVQMLNNLQLPVFLQATGLATNRLAIP